MFFEFTTSKLDKSIRCRDQESAHGKNHNGTAMIQYRYIMRPKLGFV